MGGIFSGWIAAHCFEGGKKGFFVGLGWAVLVAALTFAGYAALDQYEGHAMAVLLLMPFAGLGILGGTFTGSRNGGCAQSTAGDTRKA